MELETQLLIAERLDYITSDEANKLLKNTAEVGKILNGLIASLEAVTNSASTDYWRLATDNWS